MHPPFDVLICMPSIGYLDVISLSTCMHNNSFEEPGSIIHASHDSGQVPKGNIAQHRYFIFMP